MTGYIWYGRNVILELEVTHIDKDARTRSYSVTVIGSSDGEKLGHKLEISSLLFFDTFEGCQKARLNIIREEIKSFKEKVGSAESDEVVVASWYIIRG